MTQAHYTPSATLIPSPPSLYLPTIPMGPPSTAELILDLANASIQTIKDQNSSGYPECWICFSPTPPFYEGIALFAVPTLSNQTSHAVSATGPEVGITLQSVSGIGTCLLRPAMLPPRALWDICN